MKAGLVWIKQQLERMVPKGAARFWLYVAIGALLAWGVVSLAACAGTTYSNIRRMEIDWKGEVVSVEGGEVSSGAGWALDVGSLFGSLTWLVIAAAILLAILAYYFPSWLRHRKERRQGLR